MAASAPGGAVDSACPPTGGWGARGLFLLLLAALLGWPAGATAQPAPAPAPGSIVIRSQGSQYGFPDERDPDRLAWVFLGGVEVEQDDRLMLGDSLVIVLRRQGGGEAVGGPAQGGLVVPSERVDELFLDGDLTVQQGDELVVGAAALHLDNRSGVLTIVDGSWHSTVEGNPLVVGFGVLRLFADGTREMEDATYTTCEYAEPHWGIDTPWARLVPSPSGRLLHTAGNTLEVGGVPVFWLPGLHVNVDRVRPPLRRVGFGTSGRFGTEIRTLWGGEADELLTGVAGLFGVDSRVRGEWEVELDNYSSRGVFIQPAFDYETDSSHGTITASHIRDANETDQLDVPIEDKTRGRFKLQHRTRLDDHQVIDVEASYLSDRGFLKEYYEHEARTGKEQETYAEYRDVRGDQATTVLARGRLNDFQTQVEYLPRVEHRIAGRELDAGPLGEAFLTSLNFADAVHLAAEELPEPPPQTQPRSDRDTRIGTRSQLDWPVDLGQDRVRVTAGVDLTGFSRTVDAPDDPTTPTVDETDLGGSTLRHAAFGGVEWSRTWSGTSPAVHSDTWNLDGVRQVLEPHAGYSQVFDLNRPPEELVAIDQVESLRELEVFTVGLRHRIQTHQDGQVATVLDSDVSMPFYPNQDRDNGGRTNGQLLVDTTWRPGADVWGLRDARVRWRATIDPNDGWSYVKSFLSYSSSFGEDKRIAIAENKALHVSDFLTVGVQWVLTPKWTAAVFVEQDRRLHEKARQGLLLREVAHRWVIDYELSRRRGQSVSTSQQQDETTFSIGFRPIFATPDDETLLDQLGRVR